MNEINKEALLEAASYVGRQIYTDDLEHGTVASMSVDDRGSIRVNLMVNKGVSSCTLDTVRALIITSDLMLAKAEAGVDTDVLIGDLRLTLDKTSAFIDVIGGARRLVGRAEPVGYLLPPLDKQETNLYAIMSYPPHGQSELLFNTNDGITHSVNISSLYTYHGGALCSSSLLKDKSEEKANEVLKTLVPLSAALDEFEARLGAMHNILKDNAIYKKAVGNLRILRAMAAEYADITEPHVQLPSQ